MMSAFTERTGRRLILVGWSVVALAAGSAFTAQAQNPAAARTAARAGRYREAQRAYQTTLATLPATDSAGQAAALFGQSFASQQLRARDSGDASDVQQILSGYLAARKLDSSRVFVSASNNAAILLRSTGRHREALTLFHDAAAAGTSTRPLFLLNAGGEYESLGLPDSAAVLYRSALAADPRFGEARVALLRVYLRQSATDSLVALAARWREPEALESVNDAILQVLGAPGAGLQPPTAQLLTAILGRNLADQQPDPAYFTRTITPRLRAIAQRRAFLAKAMASLVDCYRPRIDTERYSEPAEVWWERFDLQLRAADQAMARQAWSSILRGLGDRYLQSGSSVTAASYYEAALNFPRSMSPSPGSDLGALMPLALIYARTANDSGKGSLERLDLFVSFMFGGKGEAYQANDLRRIRAFHMALGELFAQQKRWGADNQVRGVIFQLEHMRMVTRRIQMEDPNHPVFDPPLLLEHLAQAYQATNQVARARPVVEAARAGYLRAGLSGEADRMSRLLDSLGVAP